MNALTSASNPYRSRLRRQSNSTRPDATPITPAHADKHTPSGDISRPHPSPPAGTPSGLVGATLPAAHPVASPPLPTPARNAAAADDVDEIQPVYSAKGARTPAKHPDANSNKQQKKNSRDMNENGSVSVSRTRRLPSFFSKRVTTTPPRAARAMGGAVFDAAWNVGEEVFERGIQQQHHQRRRSISMSNAQTPQEQQLQLRDPQYDDSGNMANSPRTPSAHVVKRPYVAGTDAVGNDDHDDFEPMPSVTGSATARQLRSSKTRMSVTKHIMESPPLRDDRPSMTRRSVKRVRRTARWLVSDDEDEMGNMEGRDVIGIVDDAVENHSQLSSDTDRAEEEDAEEGSRNEMQAGGRKRHHHLTRLRKLSLPSSSGKDDDDDIDDDGDNDDTNKNVDITPADQMFSLSRSAVRKRFSGNKAPRKKVRRLSKLSSIVAPHLLLSDEEDGDEVENGDADSGSTARPVSSLRKRGRRMVHMFEQGDDDDDDDENSEHNEKGDDIDITTDNKRSMDLMKETNDGKDDNIKAGLSDKFLPSDSEEDRPRKNKILEKLLKIKSPTGEGKATRRRRTRKPLPDSDADGEQSDSSLELKEDPFARGVQSSHNSTNTPPKKTRRRLVRGDEMEERNEEVTAIPSQEKEDDDVDDEQERPNDMRSRMVNLTPSPPSPPSTRKKTRLSRLPLLGSSSDMELKDDGESVVPVSRTARTKTPTSTATLSPKKGVIVRTPGRKQKSPGTTKKNVSPQQQDDNKKSDVIDLSTPQSEGSKKKATVTTPTAKVEDKKTSEWYHERTIDQFSSSSSAGPSQDQAADDDEKDDEPEIPDMPASLSSSPSGKQELQSPSSRIARRLRSSLGKKPRVTPPLSATVTLNSPKRSGTRRVAAAGVNNSSNNSVILVDDEITDEVQHDSEERLEKNNKNTTSEIDLVSSSSEGNTPTQSPPHVEAIDTRGSDESLQPYGFGSGTRAGGIGKKKNNELEKSITKLRPSTDIPGKEPSQSGRGSGVKSTRKMQTRLTSLVAGRAIGKRGPTPSRTKMSLAISPRKRIQYDDDDDVDDDIEINEKSTTKKRKSSNNGTVADSSKPKNKRRKKLDGGADAVGSAPQANVDNGDDIVDLVDDEDDFIDICNDNDSRNADVFRSSSSKGRPSSSSVADPLPEEDSDSPPLFYIEALCETGESVEQMMERLGEDDVLERVSRAQNDGRRIVGGERLGIQDEDLHDNKDNDERFSQFSKLVVDGQQKRRRDGQKAETVTEKAMRGEYDFYYRGKENEGKPAGRGRGGRGWWRGGRGGRGGRGRRNSSRRRR